MNITLLGDLWLVAAVETFVSRIEDEATVCIANLETPVCPGNVPARPKVGPSLKGDLGALSLAKRSLGRLCLTLANNHTMDYGGAGLQATLDACKRLDIAACGAGSDLRAAHAPIIMESGGVRIGIIGCCESQFGTATFNSAGVAPLEPGLYAAIGELRSEVDLVIVSVHAAAEYCPWPSPRRQDLLRSLVDAGAAVVHGHHAHVPQGYEAYRGGLIFYGLGNLLVDPLRWRGHPNSLWSVVGDCRVAENDLEHCIRTMVIEGSDSGISVRWSTEDELRGHLEYLSRCNSPLADRAALTGLWQEAALRMYDLWYGEWFGGHPTRRRRRLGARSRLSLFRNGLRVAFRGPRAPSREQEMLWYHAFSCESHVDAISTALGVLCGELEDLRTGETRRLVDEMMPWSIESETCMKWPVI